MIKIYPYKELGRMDISWLKAKYHFSFSRYYNPDRLGFGKLKVINDDIVKAHSGFDTHPHRDMEIITYVRKGAITHEDSEGNKGKTEAGDVQVMSAGSGIAHSEHNIEDEDTLLYQIWIEPHTENIKPAWSAAKFPKQLNDNSLPLLVSGRPEDETNDVLHINQFASKYGGRIKKGSTIEHSIKDQLYILLSEGTAEIEGELINKGDGCEVTEQKSINIKALEECEIVIIDTP